MAITFPRDIPRPTPGDVPFTLKRNQSRSVTGAGTPQAVDVAPPQWTAQWRLQVRRKDLPMWRAWLTSLRGGLRLFKGRPRRRWPQAYPKGFGGMNKAAGGAFTGAGNLSAIGAQRDSVTVNGLPASFKLTAGDFFSIPVGARQHLHVITESVTASAVGSATIICEPPLRPNAVTAVAALFDTPWCDMALVADGTVSESDTAAAVAFEGLQVLT